MKIDRLIGIITILLQQDKITAPELAERFEVSRRTINRDIEDICKAGIPIVTLSGYGGGISIAEGYKIEKSLLTYEEVQTILAGLKGLDSISQKSYFNSFAEKFSSKEKQIVADDIIIIDLASHYQEPLMQKIASIKKAIAEKKTILFNYASMDGEAARKIEPYHIVFQWSSWYVFGYCLERLEFRLFKLNRLWDLQILIEQFEARDIPKEAINFGAFLQEENYHLKATFANTEKYRLIDEYGVDCFEIAENGELMFERKFASYENMREWVFSFGDKVNIFLPEGLARDRRSQAENILEMHN